THHRKTEHGNLALVLGLDLGDGHVETVAQAVHDGANNLAFVLEAPGLADQQLHASRTHDHAHLPVQPRRAVERSAARRGCTNLRQRPLHLFDAVRLNRVADLDVVVTRDLQTALEALTDFTHVILEALQRLQARRAVGRRVNDDAAADDTHLR